MFAEDLELQIIRSGGLFMNYFRMCFLKKLLQITVNNARQAFYMHDAHETGRGMESNPVQLVRLHSQSLWN